jgi:hypothetical protein
MVSLISTKIASGWEDFWRPEMGMQAVKAWEETGVSSDR